MPNVRIALVGDHNPDVLAHRAIPLALDRAAAAVGVTVEPRWIPSDAVDEPTLAACDAVWCVPGSPYVSMSGMLAAIRHARVGDRPFFGSCGGFQHTLLEYARAVVGLTDADHAESNPDAALPLIAPLACSLVDARAHVRLVPGTRLHAIYGSDAADERFFCRYGLNPALEARLFDGALRVSARDDDGAVRGVELDGHRFFLAALFQPELSALDGHTHPLVVALVRAAARM